MDAMELSELVPYLRRHLPESVTDEECMDVLNKYNSDIDPLDKSSRVVIRAMRYVAHYWKLTPSEKDATQAYKSSVRDVHAAEKTVEKIVELVNDAKKSYLAGKDFTSLTVILNAQTALENAQTVLTNANTVAGVAFTKYTESGANPRLL